MLLGKLQLRAASKQGHGSCPPQPRLKSCILGSGNSEMPLRSDGKPGGTRAPAHATTADATMARPDGGNAMSGERRYSRPVAVRKQMKSRMSPVLSPIISCVEGPLRNRGNSQLNIAVLRK